MERYIIGQHTKDESYSQKKRRKQVFWRDRQKNTLTLFCSIFVFFIVSPCTPGPCLNNGTCTVTSDGEANCTCDGDWTGNICDCKYA